MLCPGPCRHFSLIILSCFLVYCLSVLHVGAGLQTPPDINKAGKYFLNPHVKQPTVLECLLMDWLPVIVVSLSQILVHNYLKL